MVFQAKGQNGPPVGYHFLIIKHMGIGQAVGCTGTKCVNIWSIRNVPQDISTMTVVQGLSKAAEKGAAKAEMKSKEVVYFWIRME